MEATLQDTSDRKGYSRRGVRDGMGSLPSISGSECRDTHTIQAERAAGDLGGAAGRATTYYLLRTDALRS